jgi:hypothetical protein
VEDVMPKTALEALKELLAVIDEKDDQGEPVIGGDHTGTVNWLFDYTDAVRPLVESDTSEHGFERAAEPDRGPSDECVVDEAGRPNFTAFAAALALEAKSHLELHAPDTSGAAEGDARQLRALAEHVLKMAKDQGYT